MQIVCTENRCPSNVCADDFSWAVDVVKFLLYVSLQLMFYVKICLSVLLSICLNVVYVDLRREI